MAKKKKNSSKRKQAKKSKPLSPTTKRWLWFITLAVLCLYSVLVWFGGGGNLGEPAYRVLQSLLGEAYFLVPVGLGVGAASIVYSFTHTIERRRIISSTVLLVTVLAIVEHLGSSVGLSGGIIGAGLSGFGSNLIGVTGLTVVLFAIFFGCLIIIFSPDYDPEDLGNDLQSLPSWLSRLFNRTPKEKDLVITGDFMDDDDDGVIKGQPNVAMQNNANTSEIDDERNIDDIVAEANKAAEQKKTSSASNDDTAEFSLPNEALQSRPYTPPPLKLLAADQGKPGVGDIKANANIIKRTFENFNIRVEMDEVSIGPTVTRYAFKPAEGVRLNKIISLQSNLELALAAHPVRIEAPIPGKALVGIEVPNSSKTTVGLASLLQSGEYRDSTKPLIIALGKGISGSAFFTDIAKAPHMLIAGATGSGKSVTLHVLINSLLFRNSPEDLRLIMVDPKRVELTLYNGIPHLLNPVITQPKRAVMALKWAVKEMERRYEVLQEKRVQNIDSYHKNIVEPAYKKADDSTDPDTLPEKMPYIVVILDEVGDLMQVYPKELEAEIIRLAQMSRAVGIHLVLTTQRPDKKVITGLIKANVPTRIALQVASNIESRIILDSGGAEDLLGAGDMLFQSAKMSKPARIQSPFISEKEIKDVIKFLKKQYDGEVPDEVDLSEDKQVTDLFSTDLQSTESEDEDELYNEAAATVIQAGKASTSYLQRRLKIGYSRAARIMDMLHDNGVIGPQEGSKAREVLVSKDEFLESLNGDE